MTAPVVRHRVDDVVVGSGAGGGVIAARLSEDGNRTVVLLEAGPDVRGDDHPLAAPLRDPFVSFADADWGYSARFRCGRDLPYPRGRVVGGSTAVNAAIAIRPPASDFEGWVAAGAPDWGPEAVLPYFRRLEADPAGDTDLHGGSGPIPIRRASRADWQPITTAFAAALERDGHVVAEDQNVLTGDGGGPTPRNVRDGRRISTAVGYLDPARARPNLTVLSEHVVDRVLLDGDRVVGVLAQGPNGPVRIEAGRTLLAAGAIGTPAVLLRSGIGPADELAALGVPVVLDAPAVGKHLKDHTSVFVPAAAHAGVEQDPADYFAYYHREGDYFLALMALFGPRALGAFLGDPEREPVIALAPGLTHPRSEGTVRLRDRDPHKDPLIDLAFLGHAEDRAAMRAGVRRARELLSGPELRPHIRRLPDEIGGLLADDAALDDFTTSTCGSGYHPIGTARMGTRPGPQVVCDQRGRVFGLAGLRVADASLMPTTVGVPTNLTCLMIGERIADDLRATDD